MRKKIAEKFVEKKNVHAVGVAHTHSNCIGLGRRADDDDDAC